MSKTEDFKKLKRSWTIETFVELTAMGFFFGTYFTHGSTNTLIFWAVMFLWSKADTDRAHKKIMELKL